MLIRFWLPTKCDRCNIDIQPTKLYTLVQPIKLRGRYKAGTQYAILILYRDSFKEWEG